MRSLAGGRARAEGGGPSIDVEVAYRERRDRLYNYFRRCSVPPAGAEDLVQGLFVVLLEQPRRFDPSRGNLDVYLFGIARNLRRSWARRGRRETTTEPPERSLPGVAPSTRTTEVRQAVERLDEDQREALILREFHGFTYDEIAGVQAVAVGTVRSRLARARDRLRAILRGEERS